MSSAPDNPQHQKETEWEGEKAFLGDTAVNAERRDPSPSVRKPMLIVCALLGLASVTSFGFFAYQCYRFYATAGLLVPTTVPWATVVGHLMRAVGLGFICWRLSSVARSVDIFAAQNNSRAPSERFFWRASAWVLSGLAIYGVFEIASNWASDRYGFFRPEFESGFVAINPERMEFRAGSERQIPGWVRMKQRESEKELYVSPIPDISGKDIKRVIVRIAEIFPGNQSVGVHIEFTEEGANKMNAFTSKNLRNPMAVLVDGELRAMPRVFTAISGDAQLSNVFTIEEAVVMIHGELHRN